MMNINNLGLLNSLTSIVNAGEKDSDYAITIFILNNLYRIQEITINTITDEAFTSRSAVRRFCNRLGYNNFSDFKASINELIFPSNLRYREFKELGDYRNHLSMLISRMKEDIDKMLPDQVIYELIEQLHQHQNVILLCANNTSGDAIRFQQELLFASKAINIISIDYVHSKIIEDLSEDDLIITVSSSGKFAEIANDWIHGLKGKKLLITGNRDQMFAKVYDRLYYISEQSFANDYLGIYGKYGISYIFDLISAGYLHQYSQHSQRKV